MSRKREGIEYPKENWTKFPNCILDNLHLFTPIELKILCLIVRKNIGYQDPNQQFSSNYVAVKVNISKSSAKAGLDSLEEKGSICVVGTETRGVKLYAVNWVKPLGQNITRSENDPVENQPRTGLRNDPEPGQNMTPVLDTTLTENRVAENNTASTKVEALSGKKKKLSLSGKKSSKADKVVSARISYQTGTKFGMAEEAAQRAGIAEKVEEARALQREHAKGDKHYAAWIQVRDVIQQDAPTEAKRWSKLLAVYDVKARNAIEALFEGGIDPLKYAAWYVNHHKTSKWLQSKNLPFSWGLFGSQLKYFVEEKAKFSTPVSTAKGQKLMDVIRSERLAKRQSA